MERPVFDTANDNVPPKLFDDHIEEDKDDAPASIRITTAEDRKAARERAEESRLAERARMAPLQTRIRERQRIGDDWNGAANDNESFPLLTVLRTAKRSDLIETVMRYRGLVALIGVQPLQGQAITADDSLVAGRRSAHLAGVEEVDKAAAGGWQCETIPGGEIRQKEVRKVAKRAAGSTGQRKQPSQDDDTAVRTAPLAKRFSEDVLAAQIDHRPILGELRACLGPLIEPFEDAVLGGQTLAAIGKAEGAGDQTAGAVGKAMVFKGIDTVRDAWQMIELREAGRAADAERAATARRMELAERRRAFFDRRVA